MLTTFCTARKLKLTTVIAVQEKRLFELSHSSNIRTAFQFLKDTYFWHENAYCMLKSWNSKCENTGMVHEVKCRQIVIIIGMRSSFNYC